MTNFGVFLKTPLTISKVLSVKSFEKTCEQKKGEKKKINYNHCNFPSTLIACLYFSLNLI